MLLREKGKKTAEPVNMGWDEAQTALAAGTHVSAEEGASEGERGPDQPAAQSPKPGTEPADEAGDEPKKSARKS